jgi:hypothetical protein
MIFCIINFGADRPWNEATHASWKCQLFPSLSKLALRFFFCSLRHLDSSEDSIIQSPKYRLIALRCRRNGFRDQIQKSKAWFLIWVSGMQLAIWLTQFGWLTAGKQQLLKKSPTKFPGNTSSITLSTNTDERQLMLLDFHELLSRRLANNIIFRSGRPKSHCSSTLTQPINQT